MLRDDDASIPWGGKGFGQLFHFCSPFSLWFFDRCVVLYGRHQPGSLRQTDKRISLKLNFELGPSETEVLTKIEQTKGRRHGHGRKAHRPDKTNWSVRPPMGTGIAPREEH